jgi:sulfatase-like protein
VQNQLIVHPLLFAAYVVLFAYVHNFEYAPSLGELLVLLTIAIGCVALLWGALVLLTRDARRAAIAASAALIVFVSYGHVKNLITTWSWGFHIFSLRVGHVKMTVAICAAVAVLVTMCLKRASRRSTVVATMVLNRAGYALVLLSLAHLVTVEVAARRRSAIEAQAHIDSAAVRGEPRNSDNQPDIYYIILDAYGGSDVLKELYDYDNTAFLDWLKQKGFYVAQQSHSNYAQTMLSLASSLNLDYLDPVEMKSAAPNAATDSRWHVDVTSAAAQLLNSTHENAKLPLAHLIQYNQVAATLKEHGYRFVAFTSGYGGVQFPNADVVHHATGLSDFEESIIQTTPIADLLDRAHDQRRELHRRRIRYIFDHLADSVDESAPRFVLAHILSPHSPFVFRADGTPHPAPDGNIFYDDETFNPSNPADRTRFIDGYRGQIEYVTQQIQLVLETLLADSTRRRIIILQGDHGPKVTMNWSAPSRTAINERMSILSAYWVPPDIRARLYPTITPVNTFRIILNRYFGGPVDLLPDRSFFSKYDSPYDFSDVSAIVSGSGSSSRSTSQDGHRGADLSAQ